MARNNNLMPPEKATEANGTTSTTSSMSSSRNDPTDPLYHSSHRYCKSIVDYECCQKVPEKQVKSILQYKTDAGKKKISTPQSREIFDGELGSKHELPTFDN